MVARGERARSLVSVIEAHVQNTAIALFTEALKVAAIIALPVVCGVAALGVIIGLVQTIVQVQDQNVAFAPKLAAVAGIAAIFGPAALGLLGRLLQTAVEAMPRLAHL